MSARRNVAPPSIAIATNNGDIGGGEVMLLNIAEALRSLGIDVLVIGPSTPGALIETARERGFRTRALRATGRRSYIAALWRWRLRSRRIPLWCNGLVPSFATAGIGPRIVHLHIVPEGINALAAKLGTVRARRVLVPSEFMANRVPRATVLPNWTDEIVFRPLSEGPQNPVRIGFIGRLTRDKGVDVLAKAIAELSRSSGREVRLVLAGENRFGDVTDDSAIESALVPVESLTRSLGWVDRGEFFDSVDLAVFPSRGVEAFGLVAAEAMAAGIPFVITDAGALSEVAGSTHPWIARRGDALDLARVIDRALGDITRGDGTRARSARERWEREYSPQAGLARTASLLQELPRSGPAPRER